jgi:hypothetical protein
VLSDARENYQLGRAMSALGRGRPNESRPHQLPVSDVRRRTRVVASQGVGEGVNDLDVRKRPAANSADWVVGAGMLPPGEARVDSIRWDSVVEVSLPPYGSGWTG